MKVYVHFNREAKRDPVRLFNVASVHDLGDDTVKVVNLFGGEPQQFNDVARLVLEPEPMEQDGGSDGQ